MATFESFWPKTQEKGPKMTCDPCRVFPKKGFLVSGASTRKPIFGQNRSCLFGKNGASLRPKRHPGPPTPVPTPTFWPLSRKVLRPKHSVKQRGVQELVLSHFLSHKKCLGQLLVQKTAHFARSSRPKHPFVPKKCLGARQLPSRG